METTTTYTKDDCGCYFDSASGVYIGEDVYQFAKQHGMPEDVDAERELENGTLVEWESYYDLWDECENWMNEHFPVEDCYWGSNDNGDWGLWENDPWESWQNPQDEPEDHTDDICPCGDPNCNRPFEHATEEAQP